LKVNAIRCEKLDEKLSIKNKGKKQEKEKIEDL